VRSPTGKVDYQLKRNQGDSDDGDGDGDDEHPHGFDLYSHHDCYDPVWVP